MCTRFLLFFFLFSWSAFGQNSAIIDTIDYDIRKKIIKKFENKNELFYKDLKKKYKGKLRISLKNAYQSTNKEFVKNIQKKRFIFDARFTKYADSIAQVIISCNSDLKEKEIKIFISKNPTINALNIGNGIIILNIGLFKYLENEEQLISILAHEIAHEKLDHVANNLLYNVKLSISKERRRQVKFIRKQKYNQYDTSFKILKNLLYSDSKLHRRKEMEADSVGYLFYKKTLLSKENYPSALQLLADYDTLPSVKLDTTVYRQFFHLKNQVFKNDWLQMEEFTGYNYTLYKEKINTDSIKSHPEFKQRIDKLKKDFSELNTKKQVILSKKSTFKSLQKLARKEDVANLYYLNNYGYSIQLILYKLSKNPKDAYLKKWLGINFLSVYKAKRKYQLNRYIDKINPKEQTKEYQQFLSFLWNLNLEEIKNIGDNYSKNQ